MKVASRRGTIPQRGLDETLRAWTGQGQLWAALAAVTDPVAERRWTAGDVRRRAHRVLFQELEPLLLRWPTKVRSWLEALPAESRRDRVVVAAPIGGTLWAATRRLGWPPRHFHARPRSREPDTLLVTNVRWLLEGLLEVRRSAAVPGSEAQVSARERADVAIGLLEYEPIASAAGIAPSPSDLLALRGEGRPWTAAVPVARALRGLDGAGLAELARRVIEPDEDLGWRLFHLAILGELLHALRTSGASVVSTRPIGASVAGPAFKVEDAEGRTWDLWFEAAGAWARYGRPSPYGQASTGVPGAGSALGTDLMLIRPDEAALLLECKYSMDPGVVARSGYEQALAYAVEAHEFAAGNVSAVVVGPAEVVRAIGYAETLAGPVGIIHPDAIPAVVENALAA